MYFKLTKNLEKIYTEFCKLEAFPKKVMRLGSIASLILFLLGALLIVLNHSVLTFDADFELIARSVVKSSITILAEVVIGSLLMDYVFKKN